MSTYICKLCDLPHDNDVDPCHEFEDGLICTDCWIDVQDHIKNDQWEDILEANAFARRES